MTSYATYTTRFRTEVDKFLEFSQELKLKAVLKEENVDIDKQFINGLKYEEPKEKIKGTKIDAMIRMIFDKYDSVLEDTKSYDIKAFPKRYREYKKSKKETNTETKPKKEKEEAVPEVKSFNTDETEFVEELDFFTTEMISVFGEPEKIKDDPEYEYMWTVEYKGFHFCIYDSKDEDKEGAEDFKAKTWFIGFCDEKLNKMALKSLKSHIKKHMIKETEYENVEVEDYESETDVVVESDEE
jgi:hypothetical protein